MYIVETRTKESNRSIATWLGVTGALGRRGVGEDQKLLPVAEERLLLEAPKAKTVPRKNFDGGFSPEDVVAFVGRAESYRRQKSLLVDMVTSRIAEDVGLVEFSLNHEWKDGEVVVLGLGNLEEVTWRRGVKSEVEAVREIQNKLAANPEAVVVHMSPVNKEIGYEFKCIDFWRILDGKANFIRIMVKDGEEKMRKVWKVLNHGVELDPGKNLLSNPVGSEMKLAELFNLFELAEAKNDLKYQRIENIVSRMVLKLEKEYGGEIVKDSELVARLYSAAYGTLEEETNRKTKGRGVESDTEIERKLDYMVKARMTEAKKKPSRGCSSSTMVNGFASGEGMIIRVSANGEITVSRGSTEGLKFCDKCGCWYSGASCPLCTKS